MRHMLFIFISLAIGLSSFPSFGKAGLAVGATVETSSAPAMMMEGHDHHAMMAQSKHDQHASAMTQTLNDGACDQQQGPCMHDCHKAIVTTATLPKAQTVTGPFLKPYSPKVLKADTQSGRSTSPLIQPPKKFSF